METFLYTVIPALYQMTGGPEAQVGDQVKLYLDTDAQPGFPEFVTGIIQHPIVRVCDGTQYSIEYDPADLEGASELLVTGDVVSALVVSAVDLLRDDLEAEVARATAAEEVLEADVADVQADLATEVSRATAAEALKAPLVSPAFTTPSLGVATAVSINGVTLTGSGNLSLNPSSQITLGNSSYISAGSGSNLELAVNSQLHVTGAFVLTLVTTANSISTFPVGTRTLASLDGTESFSNKTFLTPPIFPSYTVGTLPPASTCPYSRAFVTDCVQTLVANLGTDGFSGGGSNKVPVYSDGSVWIIG